MEPLVRLTAAEVDAVLHAVDVTSPFGVRDRVVAEVLWATGVRRAELEALTLDDVDLAESVLTVRRTSVGPGRPRVIPFDDTCAGWLDVWLFETRPVMVPAGFDAGRLFTDHDGQDLDVAWFDRRLQAFAASVGLVVEHCGEIAHAARSRILAEDPAGGFRRCWGEDC